MNITTLTIKESPAYRLKLRRWRAISPTDLNALEFVQECLDKDGEVDFTSTYQYNLTDDELKQLYISIKHLVENTHD
jgi:ABC-type antimicrobial peptide transport system ATPase subunit